MSIEGDQVVYDYLSRVGDFAHGKLTPARRATLVAELRQRIEAERADTGADGPDEVRLLLQRVGDPDAVVAEELRRSPEHAVRRAERRPPALPGSPAASTEATTVLPSLTSPGPPTEARRREEMPWWRATEEPEAQTSTGPPTPRTPGPDVGPATGPATGPVAEPGPEPVARPVARPAPPGPAGGGSGIRVVPVDGDGTVDRAADEARRPLAGMTGVLGKGNKRELLAILVILAGGLWPSLILVIIGFVIAVSSRVWPQGDKRFATLGVPVITAVTLAVMLWLRMSGRIGTEPRHHGIDDLAKSYVTTLTRVIGLVSAVYLAWRLTRVSRTGQQRSGSRAR
jgi:hypothetical protein